MLILVPSTAPQLINWPAMGSGGGGPCGTRRVSSSWWASEICGASQGTLAGQQQEVGDPGWALVCGWHVWGDQQRVACEQLHGRGGKRNF